MLDLFLNTLYTYMGIGIGVVALCDLLIYANRSQEQFTLGEIIFGSIFWPILIIIAVKEYF